MESAALTSLCEAIDGLLAEGARAHGDGESVVELHRQLARLDALRTSAVNSFEGSPEWVTDGARTASAWIATRCRVPRGEARHTVRLGRALVNLPACASAWSAGEITRAYVDTIVPLSRKATAEALSRDEEMLVDQARSLRFESFTTVLAYWEQLADPDGTEETAEARRERRDVRLSESFAGMWFGKMTLDPISGAIVARELERLEAEGFEADWRQAREALGREPRLADLARTPAQRRADCLVEMARRSAAMPEGARRPAPLLSVLVGYETLHGRICELANGSVITPGSLDRYLDEAYFERVVFAPGRRIEVSATARLFAGATRRAIELRDRICTHPCCDRPASQCEADHIVAYAEGGPTTQENGRMRCGFHNRLRNGRPPPPEEQGASTSGSPTTPDGGPPLR